MKKLLLLLNCFILLNCTIPYDGETRLVLETKVVDIYGNGIPNQTVNVEVYTDEYNTLFQIGSEIISEGKTDKNGNLILIFPSPQTDDYKFNVTYFNDNDQYIKKDIVNIFKKNFNNYKLILNPVTLVKPEEIINFTVLGNKTSVNNYVKNISITTNNYENTTYFNETNSTSSSSILKEYNVLKNQSFSLNYTIVDPSINQTGTNYTQNITLTNTNFTYTINY